MMMMMINHINNIDFKQDCIHICKCINKYMAKNFDIYAIVKIEKPDITPAVYTQIQYCQPTSAAVEQPFFMLGKLLSKDRYFCQKYSISTNYKYTITTTITTVYLNKIFLIRLFFPVYWG